MKGDRYPALTSFLRNDSVIPATAAGEGNAVPPFPGRAPAHATRLETMRVVRPHVQLVVQIIFSASSNMYGDRSILPAPEAAIQR